jgi:hypothetical protein
MNSNGFGEADGLGFRKPKRLGKGQQFGTQREVDQ